MRPVLMDLDHSVFVRCWHAKTDGWAAATFHNNCGGKGPTVTIIQVTYLVDILMYRGVVSIESKFKYFLIRMNSWSVVSTTTARANKDNFIPAR